MIRTILARFAVAGSAGSFLNRMVIAALLITSGGCGMGPTVGRSIAGTPDGDVERLLVKDDEVVHESGKFLQLVDRRDQTLVLVDFWATWCGPCRQMAPSLDAIKRSWGDTLEVVKVDVDANTAIASHMDITAIPDVRIYRGGVQVGGFRGAIPRQEIESILKSLK